MISNSTNYGEPYLGWPRRVIKDFLDETSPKEVLFIPYAGVSLSNGTLTDSFDVYEQRVQSVFTGLGYTIRSIHNYPDPVEAVGNAQAIAVGGGNTFHLVYMLHKMKVMDVIREAALKGVASLGWSAGANVFCPTVRTTNDMPVIEPESFDCLNLVPFQINPHYLDANPEGHGGETRQQRIEEFLVINRNVKVAGLRESSYLLLENGKLWLRGNKPLRLFSYGNEPKEFAPDSDLTFLL